MIDFIQSRMELVQLIDNDQLVLDTVKGGRIRMNRLMELAPRVGFSCTSAVEMNGR